MNEDIKLEAALKLFDEGSSIEDVVRQYPETKEYFDTIYVLQSHLPTRSLAKKVISSFKYSHVHGSAFSWRFALPVSILAVALVAVMFPKGSVQPQKRDIKNESSGSSVSVDGLENQMPPSFESLSVPTGGGTMMMKVAPLTAENLSVATIDEEEAAIDFSLDLTDLLDEGAIDAAFGELQ